MTPKEQKKLTIHVEPRNGLGKLSKFTENALLYGAKKGERDNTILQVVSNMRTAGYDEEDVVDRVVNARFEWDHTLTKQMAEKKVRELYRRPELKYPFISDLNKETREFIESCVMLEDLAGEFQDTLLNQGTNQRERVTGKALTRSLGFKGAKEFLLTKTITAKFVYDPFSKNVLYNDPIGNYRLFNQYEPPFWQAGNYYKNEPLPQKLDAPPQIMADFLLHLVNQDVESYEYLLDWLANCICDRNLTVLTAIGDQGVGKGTLAEIVTCLVGAPNAVKVRADIFKGRFNAQIENKRFVHVDEVALKTLEEYNRFKDVVNPSIEVERKGYDAKTIINYASYYLASNEANAINPGPDDRRFSIINLTTVKIKDSVFRDKIQLIKSNKTISEFVGYLLHRTLKHDMLTPFKAKIKFDEISAAGMSEWEDYLLNEYVKEHVGQFVLFESVQQELVKETNLFKAPGRIKLEKLAKRFPQILEFRTVNQERGFYIKASPTSK